MSFLSPRLALAGFVLLAAPVTAQQKASTPARPSVEGYLCTFAGKCGAAPATAAVTRDAPATKGFRLARPADDAATPQPVAAPRSSAVAIAPRSTRRDSAWGGRKALAVPSSGVRPVESGRRADLMIGFELNSARISRQGIASASVFAQSLLRPELAGKRFAIEGHTDLRGGAALNAALSTRRAQAVADYLVAHGVDRSRLVPRGLGSDVPLPGRPVTDPQNRRVEAELLP